MDRTKVVILAVVFTLITVSIVGYFAFSQIKKSLNEKYPFLKL